MEKKSRNHITKETSVIVTKESLVERRCKVQKHKNNNSESVKTTNRSLLSGHVGSLNKNRTAFTELTHIYKRHNVPCKECNVILEKFDMHVLKQAQHGKCKDISATVTNENSLSITNSLLSDDFCSLDKKRTACTELKHIYKKHNVPYKDCKVILDTVEHISTTVTNENNSSKLCRDYHADNITATTVTNENSLSKTNRSLLSDDFGSIDKKRTTCTELKHIYNRHNVPYKECKVMLERFDIDVLKQSQKGKCTDIPTTATNENNLSKTNRSLLSDDFGLNKKRTACTELKHIYKRHNVPYKECKVILDSVEDISTTVTNENGLSKLRHDDNIHPIPELREEKNDVDSNFTKNLVSEKLPVYKRALEVESKEKDDLYVFDEPDIENVQRGKTKRKLNKKRKVNTLKQTSKNNVKKHKIGKPKICNTYDDAVQEILGKVMKKVNNKLGNQNSTPVQREVFHENNTNRTGNLLNVDVGVSNNNVQVNSTILKENNLNSTLIQKEILYEHNMDCSDVLLNVDEVGQRNNIRVNEAISKENKEYEIFAKQNAQNNNSEILDPLCNSLKTNKKINIISDITLDHCEDPSDDDTFWDEDLQPNANSTVLFNEKYKPWRYEVLKRNPHYLHIKKTGLPSLQQEMVIDYVQLKKIEKHFAKISRKSKNKSASMEESELFSDIADKENVPELPIFNTNNLALRQTKLLQENLFINKQKRNILGPRVQNANNITNYLITSTPKSNVVEAVTPVREGVPKHSYNKNKPDTNLVTPPREPVKESVNNNFDMKLFEDEEPVINFDEDSKIYIPKTRKKMKVYDHVEESSHDKHKKEMTKKEEAALEQWAAEFNSLCEDIENYNLEIE